MEYELKLCPFCSGEPSTSTGKHANGDNWYYIECLKCGATCESAYKWNCRPTPPVESEEYNKSICSKHRPEDNNPNCPMCKTSTSYERKINQYQCKCFNCGDMFAGYKIKSSCPKCMNTKSSDRDEEIEELTSFIWAALSERVGFYDVNAKRCKKLANELIKERGYSRIPKPELVALDEKELIKLRHACNVANGYLRGIGHGDSVAYTLTKEALLESKGIA